MRNILIIEDDKILNKGVAFALKKEGYNVISAYTTPLFKANATP